MQYTLSYWVDDSLITIGVQALSPEEAETKMKRAISKIFRNFPIGQLFSYGDWNNAPNITNTPPNWIPAGPNPDGNVFIVPSVWTPANGANAVGPVVPQTGLLTTTEALPDQYVYTVAGTAQLQADGSYNISNVSSGSGLLPAGYTAQNGTFTLSVTNTQGGEVDIGNNP